MPKFKFVDTQSFVSQFNNQEVNDDVIDLSGNNLGKIEINELHEMFGLLSQAKSNSGLFLNLSRTNLNKKTPAEIIELIAKLNGSQVTSLDLSMNALGGKKWSVNTLKKLLNAFKNSNIIEVNLSDFNFVAISDEASLKDFLSAFSESHLSRVKLSLNWLKNIAGAFAIAELIYNSLGTKVSIDAMDLKEAYTVEVVNHLKNLHAASMASVNAKPVVNADYKTQGEGALSAQELITLKLKMAAIDVYSAQSTEENADAKKFQDERMLDVEKKTNLANTWSSKPTPFQDAMATPYAFFPVSSLTDGDDLVEANLRAACIKQATEKHRSFSLIHEQYFGDSTSKGGILTDYLLERASSYWFRDFCSSFVAFFLHNLGYKSEAEARREYIFDSLEPASKAYQVNPNSTTLANLNKVISDGIRTYHPRAKYEDSLRFRLENFQQEVALIKPDEYQHDKVALVAPQPGLDSI